MFFVTGTYLALVDDWLKANGFASAPVRVRFQHVRHEDQVPLLKALGWLEQVMEQTDDPCVFLRIGSSVQWKHLGVLGHMLRSAKNLQDLLNGYIFYEQRFYGESIANVGRSAYSWDLFWSLSQVTPAIAQLTMSTFATVVGNLLGHNQGVSEIAFPFSDETNRQTYETGLRCPVRFGAESLQISFSRSALFTELNFDAFQSQRVYLDSSVLAPLPDTEFRKQLFDWVMSALPKGEVSLRHIADAMLMSPRTLQRRLQMLPDGFRGAVYRIRMELALHYLQDPDLSLAALSLLLGYSEQSAFHLAFKKYFKETPQQWRARNNIIRAP